MKAIYTLTGWLLLAAFVLFAGLAWLVAQLVRAVNCFFNRWLGIRL